MEVEFATTLMLTVLSVSFRNHMAKLRLKEISVSLIKVPTNLQLTNLVTPPIIAQEFTPSIKSFMMSMSIALKMLTITVVAMV